MEERMGLAPQLITDDLYKKARSNLKAVTPNSWAAIRLRAIVSAKEHGVNVVAKVFGVSGNTLRSWVKAFAKEGLSGLGYRSGRGRKRKLSDNHLQEIAQWIKDNRNITIIEIVDKLKKTYGVNSSRSAVHRILHKLKLSYITPRPVHHKQNIQSHVEFKKKSQKSNWESSK